MTINEGQIDSGIEEGDVLGDYRITFLYGSAKIEVIYLIIAGEDGDEYDEILYAQPTYGRVLNEENEYLDSDYWTYKEAIQGLTYKDEQDKVEWEQLGKKLDAFIKKFDAVESDGTFTDFIMDHEGEEIQLKA